VDRGCGFWRYTVSSNVRKLCKQGTGGLGGSGQVAVRKEVEVHRKEGGVEDKKKQLQAKNTNRGGSASGSDNLQNGGAEQSTVLGYHRGKTKTKAGKGRGEG